jgi:subtilisin family serine protease
MRILSLLSLLFVGSVWAGAVPNRLLVYSAKPIDKTQLSALRSDAGALSLVRDLGHGWSLIRYSTELHPADAARELKSLGQHVHPDLLVRVPSMAGAWSGSVGSRSEIKDLWGLSQIRAPEAWSLQKGSRSVLVANIDTGVDYNHEDLKENISSIPGYDFANKDSDPMDDQGHGTHTAGTIGAVGENGLGVAGVSPRVSLLPIKFISSSGTGTLSDAVLAIDFAVAAGARILSNSWGGEANNVSEVQILYDAVQRAAAADVLFVAAAGNSGTNNDERPVFPAALDLPNVLSVASTNTRDQRSFFSNFGMQSVHVGAPGSNIFSTLPGNKYGPTSGTSMACPHVAGLAALVLASRPNLSAVEVKQMILDGVDPNPALQGKISSGGRINAVSTLNRAMGLGDK